MNRGLPDRVGPGQRSRSPSLTKRIAASGNEIEQVINPELLNAHTHCDAKHVLSFATLRKYRDPSDPLRSLISPVPQNVIYCITCTLCKKLYIGETGRRLGDRFRKHLRDVEKDENNASNRSRDTLISLLTMISPIILNQQHMTVCGLPLHQGSTESRKTLEQKFIFQIGSLNPGVPNDTKTGNLTYDSTSTANVFPRQLQLIINFPGKKISALHC